MKKSFFLIILLLPSFGFSQNQIDIGVNIGLNISDMPGFSVPNPSSLFTMKGGVYLDVNLKNDFSISSGISFETKGTRSNLKSTDLNFGSGTNIDPAVFDYNYNYFLNYLTFHVAAKKAFGDKLKFNLHLGPFAGYLINAKVAAKKFRQGVSTEESTDISGKYKKIDFGIRGGVGLIYPISNKFNLTIEANRNLGLNNITNYNLINGGSVKTNSYQILLGASFKL